MEIGYKRTLRVSLNENCNHRVESPKPRERTWNRNSAKQKNTGKMSLGREENKGNLDTLEGNNDEGRNEEQYKDTTEKRID